MPIGTVGNYLYQQDGAAVDRGLYVKLELKYGIMAL